MFKRIPFGIGFMPLDAVKIIIIIVKGGIKMAVSGSSWVSRCQWCGKTGSGATSPNQNPPPGTPSVLGKCPSVPAGPGGNHAPKWEKR
jgi:hypothetical protein